MRHIQVCVVIAMGLWFGTGLTLAGIEAPVRPVVEPGGASGGNYHLTARVDAPDEVLSGGNYRLRGGVQPMLTGSGCCCTYLPCITR